MTTQVIFKLDKKLKDAAQAKAKKEGISLADIYKSATRSYVDGTLSVGLVYYGTLTPNTKTGRELLKSIRDIKAGKNLSKPMDLEDSIKYLRGLK
ncbi:MAG: hypothetical protein AAB446_00515 [Patescibacteria group bacterium]